MPGEIEALRHLQEAKAFLTQAGVAPTIGIVLGSGLGALRERIQNQTVIPYAQIPNMPGAGVAGHAAELIVGDLGAERVACLSGRAHLYEGNEPDAVVFGVRVLALLGARAFIVTNAAGGIERSIEAGELMLIHDHINLTGRSPLTGPNLDSLGPRFPDMSEAYDRELRDTALAAAGSLGIPLREGVYAGLLGPSYETPAEIDMLERLGASAVGMSTVLEVIALRHMGVPVLGISCITNRAAGRSPVPLSHTEVKERALGASEKFCDLLEELCKRRLGMQV
ncbi:MAG: purine-nucleoside phosphorylase [Sorangiineae bacterium NIC37A_2]|nr:MAG: purine-nucleoside phosphorylase [Sorangiineae bacterium NIC37A_2]